MLYKRIGLIALMLLVTTMVVETHSIITSTDGFSQGTIFFDSPKNITLNISINQSGVIKNAFINLTGNTTNQTGINIENSSTISGNNGFGNQPNSNCLNYLVDGATTLWDEDWGTGQGRGQSTSSGFTGSNETITFKTNFTYLNESTNISLNYKLGVCEDASTGNNGFWDGSAYDLLNISCFDGNSWVLMNDETGSESGISSNQLYYQSNLLPTSCVKNPIEIYYYWNVELGSGSHTAIAFGMYEDAINISHYPINLSLEVGTPDGNREFRVTGEFIGTNRTNNLSSVINTAMNNRNCDCSGCELNNGNCIIPFTFISYSEGKVHYSGINITQNDIPITQNVSITPLPITQNDALTGHCSYNDTDSDQAGGNQTYWYINKSIVSTGNNSFTLLGGNTSEFANITFSCRYNDTYDWGDWINSSVATVGDSTPPTLSNWTLQYTTLNDASGNTNQFNVTATDTLSNIQTISFNLNGTINVSRSFSFATSQTVTASYTIFSSSETLLQGTYNITRVTIADSSGNSANFFINTSFTVSAQPSSGSSSGGGGGGTTCQINYTLNTNGQCVKINTTISIAQNCNYNKICEAKNGEDPFSCPTDCKINTNYFTCDDPTQNCLFDLFDTKNKTVRLFTVLAIVAGIIFFLPRDSKLGRYLKPRRK